MFYPKCPKCGGTSESIEPDDIDRANMRTKFWTHTEAAAGHSHPWMKAFSTAITIGRQIYKRVPGGGAKRCTKCGHEFN